MTKHIPYGRQQILDEDIREVQKILKSDFITTGPISREFEQALANKLGARFAVTFNSGTSALHAAYFALGIESRAEFITTALTFVATANAGLYLGFSPVFSDIEEDTGNLDITKVEEKINDKTRFIVPVHYGGHPANLKNLQQIAEKHNVKIIEDGSHAIGARYKESRIGDCRYSEMTTFSFHPVKHITTGEGGAVTTNNEIYYKRLQQFRNHGITRSELKNESEGEWYYEMQYLGFNYRLTDFQSALGLSQLKRLDQNIRARREIASVYYQAFRDNPYFHIPVERDDVQSAYHLYPIRVKDHLIPIKGKIFDNLRDVKLGVQTHYIPVYRQPFYIENGFSNVQCPNAEKFYQSEISIPMYHALDIKDQEEVIKRIYSVFNQLK
jgi:UDP-4-amino-4,6-dideoxy-N-acetyl-beta-L-altrosamine transaminase